jgi:hypothetical protein
VALSTVGLSEHLREHRRGIRCPPWLPVSVGYVWLGIAGLVVGVVGAWRNLCALVLALAKVPVGTVRGIWQLVTCPDPISIQLAESIDGWGCVLGYRLHLGDDPFAHPRLFTALNVPLTTWLRHPARAMDSYRRHFRALQESGDALRQRAGLALNLR